MTPEELLQYCKDHGELYEIRISLPNQRYHSPVRRRLFGHLGGPTGFVVAHDNGHAVVTFNRDDVMMALQRVLAPLPPASCPLVTLRDRLTWCTAMRAR